MPCGGRSRTLRSKPHGAIRCRAGRASSAWWKRATSPSRKSSPPRLPPMMWCRKASRPCSTRAASTSRFSSVSRNVLRSQPMRALVFEAPDKPILVDKPMPGIKDTEVLIRSRTIGICHSDYELLAGRYIIPISYPVTPGHEWCGEIIEVGKSVKGFVKGDRVVGECVVRTPERLHHFGFSMDGADREFFNVNPEWLHKLPESVDDAKGSLIEPFTCGFHAIKRLGGTNASETVVISGGGTIGLVSAAAAIGMG